MSKAVLVVSGMCVFSTASALFMFPALYIYYKPALDMYTFEKADGVGFAHDIVVQGFIRFASIALIPVFVAVSVIYLLVSCFNLLLSHKNILKFVCYAIVDQLAVL